MPRYQYACTECDEQLEVHQSFTDDALTVCPACQGRLRKVFNAVGVVFKGSGFYKTDSRQAAASANGSGKESSSSSGTESSASDKGSSEKSSSDKGSSDKGSSDKGKGSSSSGDKSGSSSKSSAA
ncbi:MAG TPA: FmdB family zinc ribbon protein [Nocardioidaceae bacterium]|nr:FmdB family zinc ribbon protein [Nocardioidaceae bacterium]